MRLRTRWTVIHQGDTPEWSITAGFQRSRNVIEPSTTYPSVNVGRVVVAFWQPQRQVQRVVGRQRRLPTAGASLAKFLAIGVQRNRFDGVVRRRRIRCAMPSARATCRAIESRRRRRPRIVSAARGAKVCQSPGTAMSTVSSATNPAGATAESDLRRRWRRTLHVLLAA